MSTTTFVRLIFLKDVRRSVWALGTVLGLGLTIAITLLWLGPASDTFVILPALLAYAMGIFIAVDVIQIDSPARELRFLFTRPVRGEVIFYAKFLFLGLFLILGGWGLDEIDYWVNPGEPGIVYLKAYEITHNTPLSAGLLLEANRTCTMLYQDSNERIGWSSDAQELFLSATHITMMPGGWGKPYAARFELWFRPDSGKPERKLLTRNFIIEGYEN